MLFWIIAAIVAAVTITVTVREWRDSYGSPVIGGVLTLLIGSVVGVVAWGGLCVAINPPLERVVVSESTSQLKALGNSGGLQGRSYFLGGGYIEDKRVLNYITSSDSGAIKVQRSDAEDSTIYEGAKQASVKVTHVDYVNGWLSPWPLGDKHEYVFNIPTGSVVESYALDNK